MMRQHSFFSLLKSLLRKVRIHPGLALSLALPITLTQCSLQVEEASYDHKGGLLPKVAIAPIRILTSHQVPWDYSKELSFALEKQLHSKGKMRITSHSRLENLGKLPHPSLWQSADLRLADEYRGLDFLVLCSIVDYQKKTLKTKKHPSRPEKVLRIRANVRVINLTHPPYSIAFQEYLDVEDTISARQEKEAQYIESWQSPKYRNSHYAIMTNKLTKKLSDHINTSVKSSWIRREPLSRTLKQQTQLSW